MAVEPYRLTATQASAKIRTGELTVEEYARSLLSHIEERDPVVKAWEYLNPEQVIAQAKAMDAIPPEKRGPLHGVAIAVKDVIYTKGQRKPAGVSTGALTEMQICQHSTALQFTLETPPKSMPVPSLFCDKLARCFLVGLCC